MWVFYSAIQAALDLVRECPKCKRKQQVKLANRRKPVTCNHCGTIIQPPKFKQ